MPPVSAARADTLALLIAASTSARKVVATVCLAMSKALRVTISALDFLKGDLEGDLRGERLGEPSLELSRITKWLRRVDLGVLRGE